MIKVMTFFPVRQVFSNTERQLGNWSRSQEAKNRPVQTRGPWRELKQCNVNRLASDEFRNGVR